MIRDIGGVSTPPIRGGSFNSPQYTGEPWGEPLEGFLPPKLPVRAGEGALQGTVGHRLRDGGSMIWRVQTREKKLFKKKERKECLLCSCSRELHRAHLSALRCSPSPQIPSRLYSFARRRHPQGPTCQSQLLPSRSISPSPKPPCLR